MPRPNVSEQRKREIILAAAQVFTAQGLNIARMEDVAAAAGISKGTIYLYFPSKEKLIEALIHQLFQPLDTALHNLIASEAPIRERLTRYAQETIQTFDDARPLHPLILEVFALARRQAFAGEVFGTYFVRYRDGLGEILAGAGQAGEFSLAAFGGDARQAALSFMAILEGVLLLALINPNFLDLKREGAALMEAWLRQGNGEG